MPIFSRNPNIGTLVAGQSYRISDLFVADLSSVSSYDGVFLVDNFGSGRDLLHLGGPGGPQPVPQYFIYFQAPVNGTIPYNHDYDASNVYLTAGASSFSYNPEEVVHFYPAGQYQGFSHGVRTFAFEVGHAPIITSNGGGDTAAVSILENSTNVTTVTATDSDPSDTVAYRIIGGPDAARFRLDLSTGVLTFDTPPDFDGPTDSDGNNTYVVQVRAYDRVAFNGTPDPGSLFDTQTITVTVTERVAAVRDVLWRHSDGALATADHNVGAVPTNWRVAAAGNFDGDGDADILWRHIDGLVVTWEMENGQYLTNHNIAFASTGWEIVNSGDFDADGDADVLWRHRDGAVVTWEMENGEYVQNHNIAFASVGWTIQGLGDFDADGDSDVIWRHRDGAVVTWEMENGEYVQNHNIAFASTGWEIEGSGDFDGDGDDDIIWRHRDGAVVTWEMDDAAYVANHNIAFASTGWQIEGTGDFDADGTDDILWRHTDGQVVTWEMDRGELLQSHNFGVVSHAWQIVGTGEFGLA